MAVVFRAGLIGVLLILLLLLLATLTMLRVRAAASSLLVSSFGHQKPNIAVDVIVTECRLYHMFPLGVVDAKAAWGLP